MAIERPGGTFNKTYEEDMAIFRTKLQWGMLIAFLIILFCVPLFPFIKRANLDMLMFIGISIIAVHGLNILTGYCGQISVGHTAFLAVGAYTSAIMVGDHGISFWIALPCAGLIAGLVGLIFGLPALRVKGFYLALATLAALFIIKYCILQFSDFTGGSYGHKAPPPTIGNLVIDSVFQWYWLIIGFAVLMTYFAKNLVRTKVGRAFIAIRDNDLAAEVMGVSVYRYKLVAFFIGCFYAGIAGSLWAHYTGIAHPDAYTLGESVWYLGMIIIGGMGSITGGIMGVLFLRLLNEFIVIISPAIGDVFPAVSGQIFASLSQILFGLIIIFFLILEPRGLYHKWQQFKASYRLWPFAY